MLLTDTILQSRYRIVSKLSAGGMGTVYEAIDLRFNSQVALKETHFTEEFLRKQFEREAHLLYKLRHPAIARVIDHFTENAGQFLVMDYIEGNDLSDMLEKRGSAFTVQEVLHWADQLLDALSYLHKQNPPVIHRDIKPQNLKLTETGQIILLDFGLAKGFAGQMSRVTTSGSIFGYTPNYAPLEQREGTGTDPRSDLYSLAATLYKLLTNITPSDVSARAGAVIGGRSDTLKPASEVNPQVTAAISDVLWKGMAIDAEQRYASAVEMRQALRDASQPISQAETQRVKPQQQTVLPPPLDFVPPIIKGETTEERVSTDAFHRPARKPSRLALMLGGVAALLAIGYIIFTIINRSGSNPQIPANKNPATTNISSTNTSTSSPASNSNQTTNVAATPGPSPFLTPVVNLKGTEWKVIVYWDGKEYEHTYKFKQNGKMQAIDPNYVDDGTWTIQGDKVVASVTAVRNDDFFSTDNSNSEYTFTYNIEGTIQGDEMSGQINYLGRQENQRFTARRIKISYSIPR